MNYHTIISGMIVTFCMLSTNGFAASVEGIALFSTAKCFAVRYKGWSSEAKARDLIATPVDDELHVRVVRPLENRDLEALRVCLSGLNQEQLFSVIAHADKSKLNALRWAVRFGNKEVVDALLNYLEPALFEGCSGASALMDVRGLQKYVPKIPGFFAEIERLFEERLLAAGVDVPPLASKA